MRDNRVLDVVALCIVVLVSCAAIVGFGYGLTTVSAREWAELGVAVGVTTVIGTVLWAFHRVFDGVRRYEQRESGSFESGRYGQYQESDK